MANLRDVGQALKEAREAQGRTQEQIAELTRISLRHIQAIEEGNEAELPEVFYVRSFLKKYADVVGLSANEVADAYRSAPTPQPTTPSLGMAIGPIIYYVVIASAIVGVLALAWHFQPKVSVESEPSPTPTPSHTPTPSPRAVYGPTPKPKPTPSPTPAPASPSPSAAAAVPAPSEVAESPVPSPAPTESPIGVSSPEPTPTPSPSAAAVGMVEVVSQERAWVEIRANGRAVFEGLMQPGTRRKVKAKEVEVTAGNAGGVRIFVNGADKGLLGDRGMVVTKTFNP